MQAYLRGFIKRHSMIDTEKIISEKDSIWLDENNIVRIKINEGFDFSEEDVQRQFDSYSKLGVGENNKALLLVDATADFIMFKEARELSAKKSKDYFIAAAIISNSLSTRLLINFLNSVYNFGIQLKLFSNEKDALKWLKVQNKLFQ